MRQHTLGPGFGWLSNEEVRWRICDIARVTGNWNERRLQPWAGHGYLLYYHNENGRCTSYHVLRQHDVQFNDRELDCRRLEKVLGICSYKPTLPRTVEHTHWCGRGKTRTAITLCEPGLYFVEFPDEDPRLLRRENIRASLLDKGMEEWRMPTDLQPADGQLSLFEV